MRNVMNPKADFYFEKSRKWQEEVAQMRIIALDCGLTEEVKWGCPCYTFQKSNIVLIHDFKEYAAFLFFKGALVEDSNHILIQQSGNVQAARQIRFTNVTEIVEMKDILRTYIFKAIEIEKAGLKVELKKTSEYAIPVEFQTRLDGSSVLKAAFEALTPGRQRAYILHFSTPKQTKTRDARVEKCIPRILARKGLTDE